MHTAIDYLSYLGSDIAVSFMVLEITSLPVGTLSVTTLSVYLYTCIHVYRSSLYMQRIIYRGWHASHRKIAITFDRNNIF